MLRPLSAATLAAGLALLPIRPAVAAPGATGNFKLTYNVYAHGLRAMQMVAQLRLTPSGYSIVLSYHTTGIANMINRSEVVSQATGRFDGARVVPDRFDSQGYTRGAQRHSELVYHDGDPQVVLQTPAEPDRDPIAAEATRGSIDTLSAVVLMLHGVLDGHGCAEQATVFDGLRLSKVVATDAGQVQVESTDRSPYAGPAQRCDFVANQVGGILHDDDEAKSRRPMHGTASIAVPQGSAVNVPVPIRGGFENPMLGYGNLFLVKAEPLD
jgi:Protein of unknown function (DUF3108)